MLFRIILSVYYENHAKLVYTLGGQNEGFSVITTSGSYIKHKALDVNTPKIVY
jgi:hypothetical protein